MVGWWTSKKRSKNDRATMAEVRKTWGSAESKGIGKTLTVAMERAEAEGKSREKSILTLLPQREGLEAPTTSNWCPQSTRAACAGGATVADDESERDYN